ncbi:MAG TPA: sulfurtransferase TusA family protein [Actinomycetota bacterium]|nr:sulfurtransferase TusA family protein [Actinomycetota bacterium]
MNGPRIVDARGTLCPQPIVALARAASTAERGAEVVLLADDQVALTDVPAWCRIRGAALQQVSEESGYWRFVITVP